MVAKPRYKIMKKYEPNLNADYFKPYWRLLPREHSSMGEQRQGGVAASAFDASRGEEIAPIV